MNTKKLEQIRSKYAISSSWNEYKTSVDGILIFINFDGLRADCYKKGKGSQIRFDNLEKLILGVEDRISKQFNDNLEKEIRKKEINKRKALHRANIKEGDIFYVSWGYDQTNIGFYQVIGRPTPAKALIRRIDSEVVEEGNMSATVKAVKDKFIDKDWEEKACLINANGSLSRADRYGHPAYPTTETETFYASWYS